MRRLAGVSLCALMVTVCAVSGSVSDRTRLRAAPAAEHDDGCGPDSAARGARPEGARPKGARPHDHADLGRDQVVAMLDDLRRTLLDRYGTSDERRLDSTLRRTRGIVVPVRFHVVHSGSRGRLSAKDVGRQMAALNAAYGGRKGGVNTGVRFRLAGHYRINSPAWFHQPRRYEAAMKKRLRKGGPGTLNIYTAAVGTDVLGFSTFPQWYRKRPYMDGVVIDYRSIPGGSLRHFDRGYTAVHETGHWLGLFHTFENGCVSPGDGVADTPYEARPAAACPHGRDTCPQRGRDPVHNFMDYAYDTCMREFTAGQGRRIRAAWAAYRSRRSSARHVGLGTGPATGARSVAAHR